jgi:hypothetical protein
MIHRYCTAVRLLGDVGRDPCDRGRYDSADRFQHQQRFLQRGEFHPVVAARIQYYRETVVRPVDERFLRLRFAAQAATSCVEGDHRGIVAPFCQV